MTGLNEARRSTVVLSEDGTALVDVPYSSSVAPVDDQLLPNVSARLTILGSPSREQVTIAFVLAHSMHATVTVYDVAGRRLSVVTDGEYVEGSHEVSWRASEAGSAPAGVYFAELRAGTERVVEKFVILK